MCSYSWRVPLTISGDLSFTASRDLGNLGPMEGSSVSYRWNVLWNLAVLIPWIVFMLLLVRPANLNRRAWMILVPLLVLEVPLGLFAWLLGFTSASQAFAGIDFASVFVLGLASLWLISDRLGGLTATNAFLAAAGFMLGMAIVGGLSATGFAFDGSLAFIMIPYLVASGATLVGMLLAGTCCRKRYTLGRFAVWFFLTVPATVAGLLVGFALFSMMLTYLEMGRSTFVFLLLLPVIVAGCFLGALLAVILLPFMLLTFYNREYLNRFHAIFKLPGMETASG